MQEDVTPNNSIGKSFCFVFNISTSEIFTNILDLYVFERRFLCPPWLHLFDQEYSNAVYSNNNNIYNNWFLFQYIKN